MGYLGSTSGLPIAHLANQALHEQHIPGTQSYSFSNAPFLLIPLGAESPSTTPLISTEYHFIEFKQSTRPALALTVTCVTPYCGILHTQVKSFILLFPTQLNEFLGDKDRDLCIFVLVVLSLGHE